MSPIAATGPENAVCDHQIDDKAFDFTCRAANELGVKRQAEGYLPGGEHYCLEYENIALGANAWADNMESFLKLTDNLIRKCSTKPMSGLSH